MWPAESWGLGGLWWGGYSPCDPDAAPARRPASASERRDASTPVRAHPDLSFRPAPHLTLASRLLVRRAINLSVSEEVAVSTVLLLLHTRHPPTRTVGHCEIPVHTGVLLSCGFQRGDRVSTPRSGRASIRGTPPVNHNFWKVGVVIGHSSTFSLFKPRPQLTSDGQ